MLALLLYTRLYQVFSKIFDNHRNCCCNPANLSVFFFFFPVILARDRTLVIYETSLWSITPTRFLLLEHLHQIGKAGLEVSWVTEFFVFPTIRTKCSTSLSMCCDSFEVLLTRFTYFLFPTMLY